MISIFPRISIYSSWYFHVFPRINPSLMKWSQWLKIGYPSETCPRIVMKGSKKKTHFAGHGRSVAFRTTRHATLEAERFHGGQLGYVTMGESMGIQRDFYRFFHNHWNSWWSKHGKWLGNMKVEMISSAIWGTFGDLTIKKWAGIHGENMWEIPGNKTSIWQVVARDSRSQTRARFPPMLHHIREVLTSSLVSAVIGSLLGRP